MIKVFPQNWIPGSAKDRSKVACYSPLAGPDITGIAQGVHRDSIAFTAVDKLMCVEAWHHVRHLSAAHVSFRGIREHLATLHTRGLTNFWPSRSGTITTCESLGVLLSEKYK